MFTETWQVGRSTEEQVRIVAKVLDREDEVNTSDTSNKLERDPFARPTMGRGPLAGGSVKSFYSNISTRGTKTTHHVAGSRTSKKDARSSNTPFANPKQNSNKAGSAVSSHTDNTPFAFSKPNSNKAGSVVSSNTGNTPVANSKQSSSATKPTPKKTQ